ncbi:hypothetical protein [Microbispora sp. KK1-11]|uniref:hypothetical protein n=1 Tax=Microbispora sp. KK1-11 TaxID=2053005 RepID=UPI0011581B93|nr:hypothetical protein [Microbispora sp. KK1-11]TQS25132.1 hypothetical protein FLW16_31900 [Microbispora sp. KK1-11]
MTMTDNELRDLLARDASTGGGAGVTLADVDRRVRRIRRRRGAAGAVLAAGLAAVVMAATAPRTVTIAPDDGPAAAATAGPSLTPPSLTPGVSYLAGQRAFLVEEIETGGRVLRFPYTGISESVNVRVDCREPSYGFVWLNGRLEAQGVCGLQSDHVDHPISWINESGRNLAGHNEVAVALVPVRRAAADRDPDAPIPALGEQEAERVIAETGEYRTHARVTIREAWLLRPAPTPINCDRDIVIRKPNGQEILSSACDRPTGFPLPVD